MDNSTRSVFAILFHEDNYIMMEENEVCRERLCSQAIQVMGRCASALLSVHKGISQSIFD